MPASATLRLQTDEIAGLLNARARQPPPPPPRARVLANGDDDDDAVADVARATAALSEGADVVYALFVEPRDDPPAGWTQSERCVDWAVRTFQPSPAMTHVELLMPPVPLDEADRTQFATYQGRSAGWQSDRVDGYYFYLHSNANLWRAVPVFAPNAATAVRAECDLEQGVPYSLLTYLAGVRPFRWVARFLPDARRTAAHCATLTARILKNALGPQHAPAQPSASYGPATLYHELNAHAAHHTHAAGLAFRGMSAPTTARVEQLLRAPMTATVVQELGDAGCLDAVRALTLRACADLAEGDAIAQRLSQKQLATALLRWTLLRAQPGSPTAE